MKAVCLVAQGPHCFTKHIFKDFSGPHVAFLRTLLPGLNNCRHENTKIIKKYHVATLIHLPDMHVFLTKIMMPLYRHNLRTFKDLGKILKTFKDLILVFQI